MGLVEEAAGKVEDLETRLGEAEDKLVEVEAELALQRLDTAREEEFLTRDWSSLPETSHNPHTVQSRDRSRSEEFLTEDLHSDKEQAEANTEDETEANTEAETEANTEAETEANTEADTEAETEVVSPDVRSYCDSSTQCDNETLSQLKNACDDADDDDNVRYGERRVMQESYVSSVTLYRSIIAKLEEKLRLAEEYWRQFIDKLACLLEKMDPPTEAHLNNFVEGLSLSMKLCDIFDKEAVYK